MAMVIFTGMVAGIKTATGIGRGIAHIITKAGAGATALMVVEGQKHVDGECLCVSLPLPLSTSLPLYLRKEHVDEQVTLLVVVAGIDHLLHDGV